NILNNNLDISPYKNKDNLVRDLNLHKNFLELLENDKNFYLGAIESDSNNIKPLAIKRKIIMENIINGNFNINELNYYLNLNNIILNTDNILDIQSNNSLLYWKYFECFTLKFYNNLYFIDCDNKLKITYIINDLKTELLSDINDFIKDKKLEYLLLYVIDESNIHIIVNKINNYLSIFYISENTINELNNLINSSFKIRLLEKLLKI